MKIVINEKQIKLLIESNMTFSEGQIPKLISELKKEIIENKNICVKFLSMLKSLNIGEIMDNPTQYNNYVKNMKKVYDVTHKKSIKYYEVLLTFESDFDNKNLMEFENLNSDFDTIKDDMDTIISNFSDIIETVLEYDGSIKNSYSYLTKEYSPKTIEVSE